MNPPTSTHPENIMGEEITLSDEQQNVLRLVQAGHNVFFTGPAGTGKSVLLREIIKQLRAAPGGSDAIAITASTGIAGLNIGGSTVHSFAGIGLGKEEAEKLAKKIKNSLRLKERWCNTRTLIIDEVSMMDGTLFDKLEHIARVVRKSSEPFGAMQLVLSGDFFQLPPVPDQSFKYKKPSLYAFDAKTWSKCISRPIFLTKVFRQKDDTFVGILTNMRHGTLTVEDVQHLRSLSRPLHYPDGIEPSQLFPLRRDVEGCNNERLKELPGVQHIYQAMDSAGYDVYGMPIPRKNAQNLLDRMIAAPIIPLKVGAQVMLIQNIEQGHLVNGSLGKVVEFMTIHDALARDIAIAEQANRPKRALPPTFLSLPQQDVRPLTGQVFGRNEVWPLVRFETSRELLCAPLDFTIEGYMGNIEACRMQVPLILAWALSIHKSQGQTLTRVKVNLAHTFEKGQAYVAISRATSMEGLEIESFQPSKIMAHPRVVHWHQFWNSVGDGDLLEALGENDIVE